MKIRWAALGRRAIKEESGQIFVITGLGALLLVGLAGLAIEVGHGYFALEVLQASTNEATLAAATGLPSSANATTNATDYSSKALQENAIGILQNASLTVAPFCSTTVATVYGVACRSAATGDAAYNAVQVTQTAQSGLWIGQMFGIPLFNLKAIGVAAMNGGTCILCNIALIVDTTGSMKDTDTSGDCTGSSNTSETCALQGFRSLLSVADPCNSGQTCTSGTATVDDAISLFVFPGVTTGTVGDDTVCSTSAPTTVQYTLPALATSTTYQIIPFSGGATYRTSDSSTSLNSTDPLVYAAGGSTGQCSGLNPAGGEGTYYAEVIYQAGQALQVEQAARPGSQNILIILTDGNATASEIYNTATIAGKTVYTLNTTNSTGSEIVPSSSGTSYSSINGTKVTAWSAQQNISTYPSAIGECGQAVQAAYDVASKQTVTYSTLDGTSTTMTLNNSDDTKYTQVYSIAYESPNTSKGSGTQAAATEKSSSSAEACYTDIVYNSSTNYWNACTTAPCTQTVTTGGGSWPTPNSSEGSITAYSPCAAIAAMASSPNNFYSDAGAGCPATVSSNTGITSMSGIFSAIINSLTSPKLIPLGTT